MRTYWTLLRIPGAAAFCAAGFVARLPMGMRSVGCVLMVSALTGSFALAGAVTAVLALSQAAAGPTVGRLMDRLGQRRVIMATLPANVVGTVALVLLAHFRAPAWTLFPAAAVAGVAALPIGSLVRTRWSAVAPGVPGTAALEGVLDEVIYVVGPMLVTVLAVGVDPVSGVLGALVLYVAGGIWLAAQRSTQPVTHIPDGQVEKGGILSVGLLVLLFVYVATGVFFGTFDVGLIAFAKEHGALGSTGLLLGLLAAGSFVAGLVVGAVKWKNGVSRRLLFSTLALALATIPLLFADSLPLMAALTVLAGLTVSPVLITATSMVEFLVPRGALTEGYAWLASAVILGMAIGSAAGGSLVDLGGSGAALVLAVAGPAAALLATLFGLRALTPRAVSDPDRVAVPAG
ncbi:MFS transporter [Actinokineospora inagensis]|uniref:MFS transporter n=1 Tax=Actinokineospora inagensis TaxID=103730 RepID=UPI00040CD7DE|nr:MFS transporter [Actinokineospora inagensis]